MEKAKATEENKETDEKQEFQEKKFTQEDIDKAINTRFAKMKVPDLREKADKYDKIIESLTAVSDNPALEVEDDRLSGIQKKLNDLEEYRQKLETIEKEKELDNIKKDVAEQYNIPDSILRGSTKEELEDHAAELKKQGIGKTYVPNDGARPEGQQKNKVDSFFDAITKA